MVDKRWIGRERERKREKKRRGQRRIKRIYIAAIENLLAMYTHSLSLSHKHTHTHTHTHTHLLKIWESHELCRGQLAVAISALKGIL